MRFRLTAFFGTPDLVCRSPSYIGSGKSASESRVTSTPESANSYAAVAASFALCEPVRSEPGMIRIFSADMIQIAKDEADVRAAADGQPLRYTQTRAGGRFIQIRSEASVDTPGSDLGIGGATE